METNGTTGIEGARLLAPEQVAERLGISRSKVYELLRPGGGLKSVSIGRSRRVATADLEAFIEYLRSRMS